MASKLSPGSLPHRSRAALGLGEGEGVRGGGVLIGGGVAQGSG